MDISSFKRVIELENQVHSVTNCRTRAVHNIDATILYNKLYLITYFKTCKFCILNTDQLVKGIEGRIVPKACLILHYLELAISPPPNDADIVATSYSEDPLRFRRSRL